MVFAIIAVFLSAVKKHRYDADVSKFNPVGE